MHCLRPKVSAVYSQSACQMVKQHYKLCHTCFSDVKIVKNFCNIPKTMMWRSHPLYAAIGQVCRGEKACKTSLSSSLVSFFIQLLQSLYLWTMTATLWMPSRKDCLILCVIILTFEQLSVTTGFLPPPFGITINTFTLYRLFCFNHASTFIAHVSMTALWQQHHYYSV